jgi:hypothetical protein
MIRPNGEGLKQDGFVAECKPLAGEYGDRAPHQAFPVIWNCTTALRSIPRFLVWLGLPEAHGITKAILLINITAGTGDTLGPMPCENVFLPRYG